MHFQIQCWLGAPLPYWMFLECAYRSLSIWSHSSSIACLAALGILGLYDHACHIGNTLLNIFALFLASMGLGYVRCISLHFPTSFSIVEAVLHMLLGLVRYQDDESVCWPLRALNLSLPALGAGHEATELSLIGFLSHIVLGGVLGCWTRVCCASSVTVACYMVLFGWLVFLCLFAAFASKESIWDHFASFQDEKCERSAPFQLLFSPWLTWLSPVVCRCWHS